MNKKLVDLGEVQFEKNNLKGEMLYGKYTSTHILT